MAGKVRYLLDRDGRYFARLVVPKDLRSHLEGKSEMRVALGPDYRTALKHLPGAVAKLQHKIALAERAKLIAIDAPLPIPVRYPMNDEELARRIYVTRLEIDERMRDRSHTYAQAGVSDDWTQSLRFGASGKLDDIALHELVGITLERFQDDGNTAAEFGTSEWRRLARLTCQAMHEAALRSIERNEGEFTGKPSLPYLDAPEEDAPAPVSLRGLFKDYIAARKIVGKGREAGRRWLPVIDHLRKHLGHDDAAKITKADLLAWRDNLLTTHAPKTVSTVYLASIRTILKWAVENDRLATNEAANVRQDVPKKQRNREQGYTTPEATKIIKASVARVLPTDTKEAPATTAAKQWVPLLCAHTGARVVEITQLRREDFRREGGTLVARITPEAGTVKTGEYRDVPIHPQLIDLGFDAFLDATTGPLFYKSAKGRDPLQAARAMSGKISTWLRTEGLSIDGVAPSHGWRHRFKTVGREIGVADRVLDALCGHASTTAGDSYGDVTIRTKIDAVNRFPSFELADGRSSVLPAGPIASTDEA